MTSTAGVDADLGDALAAGHLGPPPRDLAAFEAAFTAQVEATDPVAERAWDRFYDATLARVADGWGHDVPGPGTVATFTRIWATAAGLSRGAVVLDVGTCFGFLPLAFARLPGAPRLLAAELSRPAAVLAARQARRLGREVTVLCADGRRLPVADGAVDTVLLLHVLEHAPPDVARQLLDEALRAAARRVVVAVPFEAAPDPVYGHVQVFDRPALARLGAATGWSVSLADQDGGWLVLDRPATSPAARAAPSGRPPGRGA